MRLTSLLIAAFALAACGFKPMYAPAPDGTPAIGPVIVDQIDGKSGHSLKIELDRLFDVERGAAAARRLSIALTEQVSGLGYRIDESASRSDLILIAEYVLYDGDGKEVLRGRSNSIASYDIPTSAYGELTAQNDARERAAEVLAARIRSDLALKLARQRVAQNDK